MTRKALESHLEKGKSFLLKRKPSTFDTSSEAQKLKREIQAWNSEMRRLLKSSKGTKATAAAFGELGRMKYGTLTEVKEQLRARRRVVEQFLSSTTEKPPKSVAPRQLLPSKKGQVKPPQQYPFDVCFSFAGEDRKKVEQLYQALTAAGVNVFYDDDEAISADLWGKDLFTHLDDIYQNKARYCLMFLSKDYVWKAWTNHERQSAQARAFLDREYILPLRLDDTPVPGIRITTGFKKWSDGIPKLTRAILSKLGRSTAPANGSAPRKRRVAASSSRRKTGTLSGHVVLLGRHLWQVKDLDNIPGKHIELRLKVNAQQLKTLRTLEGPAYGAHNVPFVNGFDAFDVQVSILKETAMNGKGSNLVTLKLVPQQAGHRSGMHRVTWNGKSITDVATEVARQLLLGESPQGDPWSGSNSNLPSELKNGILPLAKERAAQNVDVLQLAKFLAVYHLHTANVIDDITQLTLRRLQSRKISVLFKGNLKQAYSNESSEVVVKGTVIGSV